MKDQGEDLGPWRLALSALLKSTTNRPDLIALNGILQDLAIRPDARVLLPVFFVRVLPRLLHHRRPIGNPTQRLAELLENNPPDLLERLQRFPGRGRPPVFRTGPDPARLVLMGILRGLLEPILRTGWQRGRYAVGTEARGLAAWAPWRGWAPIRPPLGEQHLTKTLAKLNEERFTKAFAILREELSTREVVREATASRQERVRVARALPPGALADHVTACLFNISSGSLRRYLRAHRKALVDMGRRVKKPGRARPEPRG
jgi:hypothetical protein